MKHLNIIGAGILLSLLATTAPVYAQENGYWRHSQQDGATQQDQGNDRQDQRYQNNDDADRQDRRYQNNDDADRQADHRRDHEHRKDAQMNHRQQEETIREEQQRQALYAKNLAAQQRQARRVAAQLQQQNRTEEYRQHQDYLARLGEQQRELRHSHDYNSDPFYSTPANFRYTRDGRSYETNQYGAQLLRQAVNNGYAEGYRSGSAGRRDNWKGDYRKVFAYQDANYGYGGQYVSQSEYNYYFRQGFQRGYGDGFNNFRRYGDDQGSVLSNVLSQILDLRSMR